MDYPEHLFLIGCGNMAGAMLDRWIASELDPARVTVIDPGRSAVPKGVTLLADYPAFVPDGAVILLGIKPQSLGDVAPTLAPLLGGSRIVVSMLAGMPVEVVRAKLGEASDVVRIMPNLPVALGLGVVALYADNVTGDKTRAVIEKLMQPLGLVEWMGEEAQFNLLTALSGCGPAFVFRFVDALAQAATDLGMDPDQAARLSLATVQGAAGLAARPGSARPAQLADAVASRGGMTREGLDVLDADERLKRLLLDTLRAARDRGEVLAGS
jgi:pyrroline-5-carboxylate reductase